MRHQTFKVGQLWASNELRRFRIMMACSVWHLYQNAQVDMYVLLCMHNECMAPAFWAEPSRQGAACILGLVRESIDWQTLVTRQGTLSIDVIPLGHGTSNGNKSGLFRLRTLWEMRKAITEYRGLDKR